jgi:hypothetical protein
MDFGFQGIVWQAQYRTVAHDPNGASRMVVPAWGVCQHEIKAGLTRW